MSNSNTPTPTDDRTKTSGSTSDSDFVLHVGATILDRYVVESLLGRGGMGSVFHVRNENKNTHYALKVLNQKGQESLWKRFENEARAASKLDHPNLIKVYESGLLPDGNPFFIMELVTGETLSDLLKRHGRLPVTKALKIFIQVGFALSYAHEIGVIHRDLKPSNIMLTKTEGTSIGTIKVVDLGIAKLTGRDEFNQQTLTKTGEILGSPLYMSPEQCLGVAVDKRTDLYSLGCALFETLTGAPPLIGDSALATMMKHQSEKPVSLREASLGIEFPRSLEILVAKLLAKDPEDRFSSAHLVTAELVRIEQELQEIDRIEKDDSLPLSKTVKVALPANHTDWTSIAKSSLPLLTFALGIGLTLLVQNVSNSEKQLHATKSSDAEHLSFLLAHNETTSEKPSVLIDNSSSPQYFSRITHNGKTREFNFGSDGTRYGVISEPGKDGFAARGLLEFPAKADLNYQLSPIVTENPELMKKFRPDDFVGIEINDPVTSNYSVLKILPQFQNLKHLRIEMGIDNSYLKYIDQLPNLISLNVSNSGITGDALVKLKCFSKLHAIACSDIQGKEAIISALPKATLDSFSMESADLSIKDTERLVQCQNLSTLGLAGNPRIDNQAIAVFRGHPNLVYVDLRGTSVTPASLPIFETLPNLRAVQFSNDKFSTKEMTDFEKALAHKGAHSKGVSVSLSKDKLEDMREPMH